MEDVFFNTVRCLPPLDLAFSHLIEEINVPWRFHVSSVLGLRIVTSSENVVIVVMKPYRGFVAWAWLSIPDRKLLGLYSVYGMLSHLFVVPDLRGQGLGKRIVNSAIQIAKLEKLNGILLATENNKLKKHLYEPCGFEKYGQDPWLMIYKNLSSMTTNTTKGFSDDIIRRVTALDLATVQSICGQEHWIVSGRNIIKCYAEECEEDFAKYCSGISEPQYLISLHFFSNHIVCWSQGFGHKACLRILAKCLHTDNIIRFADLLWKVINEIESDSKNGDLLPKSKDYLCKYSFIE